MKIFYKILCVSLVIVASYTTTTITTNLFTNVFAQIIQQQQQQQQGQQQQGQQQQGQGQQANNQTSLIQQDPSSLQGSFFTIDNMTFSHHMASVNGIQLHYVIGGHGDPVVLENCYFNLTLHI